MRDLLAFEAGSVESAAYSSREGKRDQITFRANNPTDKRVNTWQTLFVMSRDSKVMGFVFRSPCVLNVDRREKVITKNS